MNRKVIIQYTLYGILVGLFFPLTASIWSIISIRLPLSIDHLTEVQKTTPLLWMIDTVPVVLGSFAYFFGVRQAAALKLNKALELRIEEQDQRITQLEIMKTRLEKDVENQKLHLKAAVQLARQAAGIHEISQLLDQVVHLISKQFGFFHAGIYLIDGLGDYAILEAACGASGQTMLSRGRKLKVGQEGMVGHVAATGELCIALDIGLEPVGFNHPDLPGTRSEIALPLMIRGEVIGVLDVQSVESGAFDENDTSILQMLAGQIALAIENARLFSKNKQAYSELEVLYRKQVRRSWRERLSNLPIIFAYNPIGIEEVDLSESGLMFKGDDMDVLEIPIELREQKLGFLKLRRDGEKGPWLPEETALIKESLSHVVSALENTRLYEEAKARADREQIINQVTAKISRTLDVDTLLRTTALELGQLAQVVEATVHLDLPESSPAIPFDPDL